tara:strand:+ start:4312 stop:4986 length:675 start_codon:yes stop_codon:yes gene_type:complete
LFEREQNTKFNIYKKKVTMNSIKKIKELLKLSKKKTYKINMYAEAILDDARVIATDSESFDIGAEVYVINDSGEVESLAEGIYTLEDGTKIRIDAESKVAGFGEEEVEEVVEEEVVVEEELSKEKGEEKETEDFAKSYEELKSKVDALEKAVYGEEMSKETTDLSADVMGEIITRLNSIEEKFGSLENEPSNSGVNVSPSVNNKEVNLSKLSVKERVAYYINKN